MIGNFLSKSRYLNGLQCPKLLWIATNEPARIPEPDAATQHIFDQGHLVGELAKKLFPGGIDLSSEDFMRNIAMTKELLRQRKPLFEAGVLAGQIYSRADILNPSSEDEWDIFEVKSSTSIKDVNYEDVAFQKLCWEDSGVRIGRCYLAHINNQYVKNGEISPEELFTIEDVSDQVEIISESIRERIDGMIKVISSPTCPEVDIGPHCSDPYSCPLNKCWDGLPEQNVFTLYRGGRKCYELYQSGIVDISRIPASYNLNGRQRIQHQCVASGQPYIDREAIREFLSGLEYPLYYLDFETFGTAIPLFDGTRPYQNIPFQFSLHIQNKPAGGLEHHEFLAAGRNDPRPELLVAVYKHIGSHGCVITYNKSFEEGVLKSLGESFPEYCAWAEDIISRLTDLIIPFRSFHYYHPAQKGSASLKSVLPALTGLGYENMPIADGNDASLAFLAITFEDVPEEYEAKVRQELLEYCKMDTEGMVRILEKLREMVNNVE